MMNNGTVGPMPEPVFNTLVRYFRIQATNPYDCYNFLPTKKHEMCARLADFAGADATEVAINRNTTEGMNLVANGIVRVSTHIFVSTKQVDMVLEGVDRLARNG